MPGSFDGFCKKAFGFLDDAGVRHLVIGGLAVTVVGEPRMTGDAEVLAFLDPIEARSLLERARRARFGVDVGEQTRSIDETGTFSLELGRYHRDGILASLPFEEVAYQRASTHKLFGRSLRFPTPEDLILLKVLAGDAKDMLDARGVARRHATALDRGYLEKTLHELCEMAQDMGPSTRLEAVLESAREDGSPG